MKIKIIVALSIILIAACSLTAWSQAQTAATEPRTITVTGNAEVRVVPDEVVLTLGVETWHKNLHTAKAENDKRVKAVLDTAKSFGVKNQHIQTDHISIEPQYEDYYPRSRLQGYAVRKTIVITLKDLTQFEDLLTATLEAGANYVHGIEFRTTQLRQYRDQARELALQAAQEKAQAMSQTLSQKIGPPLTIREDNVGWYSWYGHWWGSYRGGMAAQNVIQEIGGDALMDDTIAPGQITVQANVTVSFELQ